MSWGMEFAIFGGFLLVMILSGMWLPFAIGLGAVISLVVTNGLSSLNAIGFVMWGAVNSITLAAIPLFVFMAELLSRSGISARFYEGLSVVVRRLPGGLLQTNIAGCALFAAISGSSIATAASIGRVAMPQLDARNYNPKMACGSIAAGGTLGILIPPSITLIIYGTLTELSIAQLFMAGMVPGLLLALLFMIYTGIRCTLNPSLTPRDEEIVDRGQALRSLLGLLPFIGLIFVVLGGIYFGIATPSEAAALGASLSLLLCAGFRALSWKVLYDALEGTIRISASLIFIIMAAILFSYSIEITGIGRALAESVESLQLTSFEFIAFIVILFAVLGCVLDGGAMVVLMTPIFFPMLASLGVDPIWFGVLIVVLVEFGMLTPPFGLNLFVVNSISGRSLGTVVAGCIPYYVIMLAFIVLLALFPAIALWLPSQM